MPYWLEPELQQYFDAPAVLPSLTAPQLPLVQRFSGLSNLSDSELCSAATAALAEDPALSFMLRLDSVLGVHGSVVSCLVTVRRNVHHYELLYLQRFKQIAEPAVRHPKSKEQVLLCLDPKTLRCGQQILVKFQLRQSPTEPLQLLREFSVLRASGNRDPAIFPRAYLFGCLGDDFWRLASSEKADPRRLVVHKRHFLLCQYVEDSVQRLIDTNRSAGHSLSTIAATRVARDMLTRLKHLHGLGWIHGDLRPACFLLNGGMDELLLSDFTSATPIRQDCLPFNEAEAANRRDPTFGSERFAGQVGAGQIFADLESLVYILCALMTPHLLPWEPTGTTEASNIAEVDEDRPCKKTTIWKFVEADEDPDVRANLWSAKPLSGLFNCLSQEEVSGHPGYRLAAAITRLHSEWLENSELVQQQLPDYGALFACLKE